jgi:hypothetical protein
LGSGQNGSLYGGTVGDSFIRVDVFGGFFSVEKLFD